MVKKVFSGTRSKGDKERGGIKSLRMIEGFLQKTCFSIRKYLFRYINIGTIILCILQFTNSSVIVFQLKIEVKFKILLAHLLWPFSNDTETQFFPLFQILSLSLLSIQIHISFLHSVDSFFTSSSCYMEILENLFPIFFLTQNTTRSGILLFENIFQPLFFPLSLTLSP